MPRWGLRWLLLALLEMLHVAGWSAYYAVTRLVYAGDEGFLYALSAAETLPALAAGLGALLAERRGYRAAVGLGVGEGAALAAAGLLVDSRPGLWAAALAASLLWSVAGPQVYAYVLSASGGSGSAYGLVSAGATLGWSLGSLAPLWLEELGGPGGLLAASGLLVSASYAAMLPLVGGRPRRRRWGGGAGDGRLLLVVAAAAGVYVASETVSSIYMGRLALQLDEDGYALVNAAAGLASAAARPLAGLACDRVGAWRLLFIAIPVYAAYIAALEAAPPRLLPILWVAPLYPLLDTPLGLAAAEAVGEHRGAAALAAAYTAAGLVMMASAVLEPSPLLLAEAGLAAAAASLAALSRAAPAAAAPGQPPARPGRRRAK